MGYTLRRYEAVLSPDMASIYCSGSTQESVSALLLASVSVPQTDCHRRGHPAPRAAVDLGRVRCTAGQVLEDWFPDTP
jgi:hypothetical protein